MTECDYWKTVGIPRAEEFTQIVEAVRERLGSRLKTPGGTTPNGRSFDLANDPMSVVQISELMLEINSWRNHLSNMQRIEFDGALTEELAPILTGVLAAIVRFTLKPT
jgi:hypothetical protein